MRIKKIHIQNYKSLVDFKLEDIKPFTAFVGPNASGKSNFFEALEFLNYLINFNFTAPDLFGGLESIVSYDLNKTNFWDDLSSVTFELLFDDEIYLNSHLDFNIENPNKLLGIGHSSPDTYFNHSTTINTLEIQDKLKRLAFIKKHKSITGLYNKGLDIFADSFTKIFVNKLDLDRVPVNNKLKSSGKNLEEIIAKIFQDQNKSKDFIEWLRVLVPEFKDIVVKQSNIDGSFAFEVIEKSGKKAFPVRLLSDGTKNILTLMAAVYQQEQQFLCIEEPENGLHPQAIELLVDFFREKCEGENGHHIWLNTHSPTLIRCLEIDEVITVNKINGRTIAKQNNKLNNANIKTDEAWLSNALGGGVSWSK